MTRFALRQTARKRTGAFLVDNMFGSLQGLGKLHPVYRRPTRYGVEAFRNLTYLDSGRAEHRLDVYRPVGHDRPLPIVLYVHGGGFRILSKDSHALIGLQYARHGYLVFNINYRLAPAHQYPAAIEDTCAAYRWVLDNAERFGGDLSRLVVAGESAGGNLVTSLTICTAFRRPEPFAAAVYETGIVPRATVPIYPLLQVSDVGRFSRRKPHFPRWLQDRLDDVEEAYLGLDRRAEAVELADPILILERGDRPERPIPPMFVPVGTRDPVLPDARRLVDAIARLGGTCEARYYPGELHAFHVMLWRPHARDCWRDMLSFMHRKLAPSQE